MKTAIADNAMPRLRFPDFKDEGEDRKLTDLCHRIGDGIHSTPVYSNNGDCHFINGNNLKEGTIKIEPTTKRVDLEEAKKHHRPLSHDTILLSINGTIGNMAFYRDEQVILGKSACYINVDDAATDKRYIYSFLGTERVRYYFESELTGSTIRNLSLAAIRNLHLSLPTLPEQRKIADFLTAVDRRISQLTEKKALLEDYKKGVMQQLFSQAIRFKDDEGKDFPDWEEKKLGEVGNFIGGGTPDTNNESFWSGDIPWISSSDISDSSITQIKKHRFITPEAIKESAAKLVPENSILFISRVGVGKLAVSKEEVCTSQDFSNFTPAKDHLMYLGYYFVFNQNLLKRYAQGTSIQGITTVELKKIAIKIPCRSEQTKIADFLSAIDRKIESVATQITETQTFKRGLLQQMFV